jgi:uncharacterized protein YjdB
MHHIMQHIGQELKRASRSVGGRLTRRVSTTVALLALAACGGGESAAPKVVATVDVAPLTVNMAPGQSTPLTATAREASGAAISGRAVTWTSSAPSVVTVSAGGVLTGVSDGTATVTANIDGRTGSAAVVVRTPVASVLVTPNTSQLTIGKAPAQLSAVARDAAGNTLPGRVIQWASTAPAVATVSQTGLVTAVAAGTTTINALSEGATGTAAITVIQDPCTVIRALTYGTTASGTLAATDCKLTDNTATQAYEFTLPIASKVEILMTSTAVDAYVFLTDAALKVIAEDDDGGGGSNARIMRTLPAGRYVVIANTYDANSYGAYQLVARAAPTACTNGRATQIQTVVPANLATTTACRLNDNSYEDRYDIVVTSKYNMAAEVSSSQFDPILFVLDEQERIVAQDDDGGAGTDAALEVLLEPGRYTILARGYPNRFGAYRLTLGPVVDPCAVTKTVAVGQTIQSTLGTRDCAISDNGGPRRYFQRFGMVLGATTSVQFDMVSSAVDAYLVVQNAQTGAVVAENDDSPAGGTTNSRIVASLPAGQYIVNTTTFDAGETGLFLLAVSGLQVTSINLTASPTSANLQTGQTVQATATISGTTNLAIQWTSANSNIASVSPNGLIRAVGAGQTNITVTSLADPSKFVTIPVTVAQSTTTNLDISTLYFVQATQLPDGRIPLVADRGAVARVFVRGSRTGLAPVPVRLRILQGTTVLGTFNGTATPAINFDEACCSANIVIPSAMIKAGVSFLAEVDPDNTVAESAENDNQFPLSGTAQALNVVNVPPFNLRLVPVQQNRNGPLGVASTTLLTYFRSMWPVNTINVVVRAPLVIDYTIGTQSFDDWGRLVRDIEILRQTEGTTSYYYGLVRTTGRSGVLGLANGITARTAIGIDEGSDFGAEESRLTFVHEMGHTLSLRHSPCGGAAGPEPSYPFPDGRTGSFGMDLFSNNVIQPPTANDIMTYCRPYWVSAFNFRKVMDFRQANPNGAGLSAPTSVLLVSGGIVNGTPSLDPAFSMTTSPAKEDAAGRYVIEGFDANDRALFTHRFSPYGVDDAPDGTEAFVVAVPVAERLQAQVVRLSVREVRGSKSSMRVSMRDAGPINAASMGVKTKSLPGSRTEMSWSPSRVPAIMVRDRRTGDVLAILRNGAFDLSPFGAPDRLELLMSDGVKSAKATIDPITGAIRQ